MNRVLCVVAALAVLTGCSPPPEPPAESVPLRLARDYFASSNAAARQGPQAQQDFFARTQHPDFTSGLCDLGGTTVQFDPAWGTFRPDPGFTLDGNPPRGELFVVGVEVTTRTDGTMTGRQVGSQHLAILDGHAFGFAPCPTG